MLRRSERRGLLGNGVDDHASTTLVRRVGWPVDIAVTCAFPVGEEAGTITAGTSG
jgi:hypothetical protein